MEKPFPAYEGDKPYFFVSYGHGDTDIVYPEMTWIRTAGFHLWYDDGIHVGTVWRQALADALSSCSGFIFFSTVPSNSSDNCLKEINFALEEGKPVFVVQLDDTPMPSLLRLSLSDRQALVRSEYDEATFRNRLISALSTVVEPDTAAANQDSGTRSRGPGTDAPSFVVLQFTSRSQDPDSVLLGDGITSGLVRTLSAQITYRVIRGRESDMALEPMEIGKARNVRYIISGDVQKAGDRVRVTAILTNTSDGEEITVQQYDRTLEDQFALQDQVASAIWEDILPHYIAAEHDRARHLPDEDLDAWALCMRANSIQVVDRETRDERLSLLERALEMDPRLAFGHYSLASSKMDNVINLFSRDPEADKAIALSHADRALTLSQGTVAPILLVNAYVHRVFGDEAQGLRLAERHAKMTGRESDALYMSLILLDRAEEVITRADRDSNFNVLQCRMFGTAYVVTGQYAEAHYWIERAVTHAPRSFLAWSELANVLGYLDRLDEGRSAVEQIKKIVPTWTLGGYEKGNRTGWRDRDSIVEALVSGIRKLAVE